jgi:hypothetical protein
VSALKFTRRPFELSASFRGSAHEQLIEDLQFKFGNNNLRGWLRHIDQDVPAIKIALTSSHFNLDELRVRNPAEDEARATMAGNERLFPLIRCRLRCSIPSTPSSAFRSMI